MTAYRRSPTLLAVLAAGLVLAGCSGGAKRPATASVAVPTAAGEIAEIAALLDKGERRDAERRIERALKRDPMNPSLMMLQQGVEGDAKADLGPTSYPYTVKPGETMGDIAQALLGNRLKAYQLARYNDIDAPATLAAGRVLRIPGQPPRAAPPPRTTTPRPATPPPAAARPRTPAAKPAPAAPARPAVNAAGAQRARSAGLAALNQGNVTQAVTLLRRAAALDPGNPAIARDLARAERIAATVRARR